MSSTEERPDSFLRRMIRGTREQVSSFVQNTTQNAGLLQRSFQHSIRDPIYEAASETRDLWRQSRREKPGVIVATATVGAMMTSIPFGRWAFIRNTILTAGLAFAVTSPETLVDILRDTRPRRIRAATDQMPESSPKQ